MKLITKEVSNPEKKFWIWDEKITNKQDGRIYPHNTTNVGSGKSVAVYQLSESGKEEQIAQLEIPDYKKLEEYYWQEKEICLDYTYIDEFEWLGDKVPYEVEGNPYREYEKITARAAIFYSEEPKLIHLMQLKIQSEDLDFSYAGFYNLNLDICDITLVNGNNPNNAICTNPVSAGIKANPSYPMIKFATTVKAKHTIPKKSDRIAETINLPARSFLNEMGNVSIFFNVSSVYSREIIYPLISVIHIGKIIVTKCLTTCSKRNW